MYVDSAYSMNKKQVKLLVLLGGEHRAGTQCTTAENLLKRVIQKSMKSMPFFHQVCWSEVVFQVFGLTVVE